MSDDRIRYLLEKYFAKTCTAAEREELAAILVKAEHDETVKGLLEKIWMAYSPDEEIPGAAADAYYQQIMEKARRVPPRRIHFLHAGWLRYAAAIIIMLGIGGYFLLRSTKPVETVPVASSTISSDIAPGVAGAVLVLADGSRIALDSLGSGVIAHQGGTKVVLDKGRLAYEAEDAINGTVTFNTMSTPRGRQFQLLLPDGSKVWLNAASAIKFPTAFTGNERTVELEGEAYFEVAKNPGKPFRVSINGSTEVEVLGTHFNINSYRDEAGINTTLLEGAVKVTTGKGSAVLKPGEQAQETQTQFKVVKDADVGQVMAWKNGYFRFDGMDLPMVMRQVSRWYDVEVRYQGKIPDMQFGGELPRSISLRKLLTLLEFGDVRLEVSGRQITIIGQ